ncbi:S8 family serine peptidase [Actinokineospora sp. HUAS TT18]|uniref:S8 family serine peptidase n=1 Tax=Actinokineospora sp. HUAS TT18 TaxID=3447451 RepID=UPI003F51CCBF
MIATATAFTGAATLTTPAAAGPASSTKIESTVSEALENKDSTDFWVMLSDQADLSAASRITDWGQRGQAVLDALRHTADSSQAGVKAELTAAGVDFTSYFAANTIHVHGGTAALAERLAGKAEVTSILASRTYEVPTDAPAPEVPAVDAVEWGIAAINADDVWATYGTRGEGIVVGDIDTGVQWDHPALIGKYRGNAAGGVDHNYNWYDPARACPTATPCDNHSHGTHTMGTMVGSDGANQIGVAPGAKFIAAKGCPASNCTTEGLLAAGQWMLAPTDLTGANPRPELRPHVVNNSWGGTSADPWYQATVQAWRAAGIFPSFSNGNAGPACSTSGAPGVYPNSYASGAFDVNGAIASFSSRGPGVNGTIKPNLAAPGVSVRSSVPGNGYGSQSGTSMAAPHTSGSIALIWSAAPALIGDIAATEALLNGTAVDTANLACGGTAANNNVFGEGKLDVLAAVDNSPRGPMGTMSGTVTNAATGAPIAGAKVFADGERDRTVTTNAAGRYTSAIPVGDYSLTVSAFGFAATTAVITVTEGQETTRDAALTPARRHTLRGVVRGSDGSPVTGSTVAVANTPLAPVVTGADGAYAVPNIPEGQYRINASAGSCNHPLDLDVTVDGDETADITLPTRKDSFGFSCFIEGPSYVEGDTPISLTGDDAATVVPLPFEFWFYGRTYSQAHVGTNGHVNFLAPAPTALSNTPIPSSNVPNAAIYPFWDDLRLDATSRVMSKTLGTAPNRQFVIEWRDTIIFGTTARVDFEAVLFENGEIAFRYRNLDQANPRETGSSVSVGIENQTGAVGFQYSLNQSALTDNQAIHFKPPANGVVSGAATDSNDGLGVAGATIRALKGGVEVDKTTTGADGTYRLRLLGGDYQLEMSKHNYVTGTSEVTITTGDVATAGLVLDTSRVGLDLAPVTFLAQEGQLRTATRTLNSTGLLSAEFTLTDNAPWLWAVPGAGVGVKPGASQELTIRTDPNGLRPGVHTGSITVTTNAGRTPTLTLPVTLVVPAFRVGLDSGGNGFVDGAGDTWVTDTAWTPGGFGYLSNGPVVTTKKAIAGTTDDALFQSQRESAGGYRYDSLPEGTYQVRLDFAELKADLPAGRRVFDVSVNGKVVLPDYDIAARVGSLTADSHEFWVTVPEGGSIAVDLAAEKGKLPPVINSLRITHRPDHVS